MGLDSGTDFRELKTLISGLAGLVSKLTLSEICCSPTREVRLGLLFLGSGRRLNVNA